KDLAALDLERGVSQRPDRPVSWTAPVAPQETCDAIRQLISERVGTWRPADPITFGKMRRLNRDLTHQITSAKVCSVRLKYTSPPPRTTRIATTLIARTAICGGCLPRTAQRNPSMIPTTGFRL